MSRFGQAFIKSLLGQEAAEAYGRIDSMSVSAKEREQIEALLSLQEQKVSQFEIDCESRHERFVQESLDWYAKEKSSREFTTRLQKANLGHGLYNFRAFDGIDPSMLPEAAKGVRVLLYNTYKKWAQQAISQQFFTQFYALTQIKQFGYFEDFKPIVEHTIHNFDYFRTDRCIGSILNRRMREEMERNGNEGTEFDAYALARFLTETSVFQTIVDCDLLNWYPIRSQHSELIESLAKVSGTHLDNSVEELIASDDLINENYIRAVDIIAGADRDDTDFDMIKIGLLRAAQNENADTANIAAYEFLKDAAKVLLSSLITWEEDGNQKGGMAIPIDLLIAEATKLQKAGMIGELNKELAEQLELYVHASFKVEEELKTLASFFGIIGAYDQELMVYECMITNNLPRDEHLEARAAFLKSGGAKQAATMAGRLQVEYTQSPDKLAVDYRTVSWSDQQITSLFDMYSSNYELLTTPLVVAEWNRTIPTPYVKWDNSDVCKRVEESIADNFGDALIVSSKAVAVIMEGELDYVDSVVITPARGARYPWLGFVLSGEQFALKQAAISLFALYYPSDDFEDESSDITRNQKAANRTILLKMKQNPRINNYINMIESLLVEELESYFNGNRSEDIY